MAGRAHRDGDTAGLPLAASLVAKPNLQRFLDGDPVIYGFAQISAHLRDACYLAAACHYLRFQRFGRAVYRSGAACRT